MLIECSQLPWKELDKEEYALWKDPYSCVGHSADNPGWIGGRVHFTATLQCSSLGNSPFDIKLESPAMGSSNRFARRFGSHTFLRVRIPDDVRWEVDSSISGPDNLIAYFTQPFIIHHSVFRSFYAKDGHVFLFRTVERWDGSSITVPTVAPGSTAEFTAEEFLSWHNNLNHNLGQSMTKWAARFALGLSNSVPGVQVKEECIQEVNDIVCPGFKRQGKVPSQMVMTDGCGLTSHNVLRALTQQLGWLDIPTAVQMRLAGAKGLLLTDPAHTMPNTPFHISLRPSQIKIDLSGLGNPIDPAMLTIDIIKPSRLSTPSRLSEETIINLAENGVPLQAFVKLMKDDLQARVDGLTQWTSPASVFSLYRNVGIAESVTTQRLVREAAGTARAKGYTSRDVDEGKDEALDEDGLDNLDDVLKEQSVAWWADPTSGCPSTIAETALVLLDSGFLPDTCPVLASKLKHCVKMVIKSCKNKCHIAVPMSCTAFVVPDPCNVLEPNEVHVKSSSRNLLDQDGMQTDLVLGEVLVTRHPCKLPTDVQKVTAVYRAELSNYVDVVVVSTKNHLYDGQPLNQHLASMTGGGDYDGDTLEVFWDPSVVSSFTNANPKYAQEPKQVKAVLSRNPETVPQFLERTSGCSKADKLAEMQKYLLGSLQNVSRVGTYSNWWLASVYKNGYSHPDTIFLAYMFTNVLDGAKTGITVSRKVFEEHRKAYSSLPMPWTLSQGPSRGRNEHIGSDEIPAKRNPELPPFTLELLHRELQKQCNTLDKSLDTIFPEKEPGTTVPLDEHLAAPWQDTVTRAQKIATTRGDTWMQTELDAIATHVAVVYTQHMAKVKSMHGQRQSRSRANSKKSKGGASFTDLPIEQRQDIFRELSRMFEDGPATLPDGSALLCFDKPAIRRLRASYAYILDRDRSRGGWSRFPWDVAMRTLCEIKVEALGGGKTLMEEFYYKMTIPRSFVKGT
ncbi:RNA dependent RNA polymerase-domain-containing protein [Rhodofomes roseus]|uniref:RNA-dependent RNA polymerase n=1 Tax=Rhodofomes roseus TaxID=34475 RepID=A0ABQ8KM20_9APHY|nr:RNA dependent RNA polymerase-domain-containing protein [Rhodofomes roseus]KAH9838676.1 RNA dependent RNA polymerase-domain-containing protein [Rhodofomes roseus]